MTFPFECPNGHVLEAEPEQSGQTRRCPTCGELFLVPAPPVADIASARPFGGGASGGAPQLSGQPAIDIAAAPAPTCLHIPCPNGHQLETPREMLDQLAQCPFCEAEFRLRESDSIEHRERRRRQDAAEDARAGRMWLNLAVVFGVLVTLGLGVMLVLSFLQA